MTGAPDDRLKGGIRGDHARRERLAAELRANLKRRKAQSRAIADADENDRMADNSTSSGDRQHKD